MTDLVAIVLGVLFLVLWVCALIYANSLTKAYSLGKEDYIRHKNRTVEYTGLARRVYRRGRRCAAVNRNTKLKSRLGVHRLTT